MNRKPHLLLLNPGVKRGDNLSLGYIAAYVKANGFAADVVDFALDLPSNGALEAILAEKAPILIGLSACQLTMPSVLATARWLKERSAAPIILGGAQAFAMPDQGLAELADIDYLCRGEGEPTTLALMDALACGRSGTGAPGVSHKDGGGAVGTNPGPPEPRDLDEYPSPYLDGTLQPRPRTTVCVASSRGCPFACSFCITPTQFHRRIRYHSIDRVVAELTHLRSRGIESFFFTDALFCSSKRRSKELMRAIHDSGVRVRIWCEARPEILDDELLGLMRRAGVTEIAFGMESMNPETMTAINKKHDVEAFTRQVRRAQSFGLHVHLLHIYGLPGDSWQTMWKNIDYVVDTVGFMGKSRGQWLKLWFGAEAAAHPESFGLTVSRRARSKTYPAYLSAHENVRNAANVFAFRRSRRKVAVRAARETSSALPAEVDFLLAPLGVEGSALTPHAKRTLLPIARLAHFVCTRWMNPFERFDLAWSSGFGPHAVVLLHGRDGDEIRDGLLKLEERGDHVSLRSQLGVIGRGSCAILDPDGLRGLERHFARDPRCFTSFYFAVTPEDWQARKRQIAAVCASFTGRRRFRLSPRVLEKGRVEVSVLLDATHAEAFPRVELEEMRTLLGRAGARVFPFLTFDDRRSVARFREDLERDRRVGGAGESLLVFSSPGALQALELLYDSPPREVTLPPLVVANGVCVLYPGAVTDRAERSSLPKPRIPALPIGGAAGFPWAVEPEDIPPASRGLDRLKTVSAASPP